MISKPSPCQAWDWVMWFGATWVSATIVSGLFLPCPCSPPPSLHLVLQALPFLSLLLVLPSFSLLCSEFPSAIQCSCFPPSLAPVFQIQEPYFSHLLSTLSEKWTNKMIVSKIQLPMKEENFEWICVLKLMDLKYWSYTVFEYLPKQQNMFSPITTINVLWALWQALFQLELYS